MGSFLCKKEPGIPEVKFLASILGFFAHAEKLRQGLEKPGVSELSWLSRNSWKSPESKEKIFHTFRAFPYVQKPPELLTRRISGTPWFFLDSRVSWKAQKVKRKCPTLSKLFLTCKKAWIELLTRMISSTLSSYLILGFPGKAKRKYSMPSRLFLFKKAWNPCRLFKT